MAERLVGLTTGEAWWLARRRLGRTQERMAATLGVSLDRLRDWERGTAREAVPEPRGGAIGRALGAGLTAGEFLALVRRRKGWTAARAATWAKVSRLTYLKAEADRTSSASRLAARWLRGSPPGASAAPVVRLRGPRV